jgi:uncharacterized protein YndB with AHSA1/START domain
MTAASQRNTEAVRTETEPIVQSVEVELPLEQAFELFTSGMTSWWPLDTHSIAADTFEGRVKADSVRFEARLGGRVLEYLSDGTSLPWGEVIAWEPPKRFVMTWKPNLEAGPPTEVEVRFSSTSDGGTLVRLEHRAWERLGDAAAARKAGYRDGWGRVLGSYRGAATSQRRPH